LITKTSRNLHISCKPTTTTNKREVNPMNPNEPSTVEALRLELVQRLERATRDENFVVPTNGLLFVRASQPTDRIHGVTHRSLCVIAQGAKEILIGDGRFRYDPDHYLLASVELPMTGKVVEATPTRPYLALRLDLEPSLVGSVLLEAGQVNLQPKEATSAVVVSKLDSCLFDAVVRLVRATESPWESRLLIPLIKREIVFRLLMGEQRARLLNNVTGGSHSGRIAEAINQLRTNLVQTKSIEALATEMGMSVSGFHHHFKAVTNMSPLQFQKQLRLQEARRLLVGEQLDAASAGYRVGYENPSHFSRDYKKHFGHPPARDAERLRTMAIAD